MLALIKMEFYQLVRNRLFYLMAGISIIFGALMSSGYIGDTNPFGVPMADGLSVFGGMVYDSTMWLIVTGAAHGFDKGIITEPFAQYLLRVTGMVFLANCAVFSVSILLMAVFQDAAKTTACATLAIILESFGMVFFLSRRMSPLWLPPYMARAAVMYPLRIPQIAVILTSALIVAALMLGAGGFVFRHKEIK